MLRLLRPVCALTLALGFLVWLRLAVAETPAESALVFELHPAQSRVTFTLSSLLHTIHGTFQVKRGHLRLQPSDGTVSGECVVDARSGNSGSPSRDSKMHRTILASERYPEIVFVPTQVRGTVALAGTSTVDIDGTFTIQGASHPLTTTATVTVTGEAFTFTTHFVIPYVQWGLKDPSTFILTVEKQVEMTFEAVGHIVR
jgi:polyisoprenoid-binding protein YceI